MGCGRIPESVIGSSPGHDSSAMNSDNTLRPKSDAARSVGGAPAKPVAPGSQWQIRLAISIPALIVLFTLAFGIVSYQIFSMHWYEIERAGALEIARSLLRGHLYTMFVLVGLALIAGSALAWTILKPIREINETARMIAGGRLDQRAPAISSSSEIGDLSRSFNSMLEFVNDSIQERNRYFMEGVVTGILTAGMDRRIEALNSTGAGILGIEPAEIVGRTVDDLLIHSPRKFRPLWDYLAASLDQDITHEADEIELSSGSTSNSLMVAVSHVRDAEGVAVSVILNFRDTERIRSLNRQLSKTDQLAALGTFTMGLAHELRNPLGSIKGMVQLLEMSREDPEDHGQIVTRVVREVDRLDRFIRELLDFSNQSPAPPEPLDLRAVLRDARQLALKDAALTGDKDIEVLEDFEPVAPAIAEADRLIQACANIIRNAFDSARSGSRITLMTRTVRVGRATFAEARIHNTGSTINPEDREKIFDPFFTTRDSGSGLGLSVAYQIISQNFGTLDLAVGPDEVSFIIRLRTAAGEQADPGEVPSEVGEHQAA